MGYAAALKDYEKFRFKADGWTRTVYKRGSGPAVIIIHEIPGLHPQVIRFADHVAAAGMTVYMPSLFGTPGKPATRGYAVAEMIRSICIRREFNVWANGKTSPIVDWLRALARKAHADCGGKGVGAVGMCFTGGFALAMMTDPSVVAPVLSQPSMPIGRRSRAVIDCSAADFTCAKQRMTDENLSLLGLRFTSDKLVTDERFAMLKRELGDRFEAHELADADALPGTGMAPHSVLTIHLDDRPGTATKAVETRVIEFFRERVGAA
jgi:dienelactone hydrolase